MGLILPTNEGTPRKLEPWKIRLEGDEFVNGGGLQASLVSFSMGQPKETLGMLEGEGLYEILKTLLRSSMLGDWVPLPVIKQQ